MKESVWKSKLSFTFVIYFRRNIYCLLHHFVHTFPSLFILGFGCFHFCTFLVLKVCDDWSPKLGLELVPS